MKVYPGYIFALLLFIFCLKLKAQRDSEPPEPPVLNLVNVDYTTGNVEISWFPSPSADVSGYVIYLFKNNEGYALDTLYNPSATTYLRTGSGASYYSESFVVAAIDTAGNISPLSNNLSTIYASADLDTCNKRLEISWNSYLGVPNAVQSYSVFYSKNGSSFTEAGNVDPDKDSLLMQNFDVNTEYCFIVRANLSGGYISGSDSVCLITAMQRLPQWINADYATVREDSTIALSFSIDPSSEIKTVLIEKSVGSPDDFQPVAQVASDVNPLTYNDISADISKINFYRASVFNNCNMPVVFSNLAVNIVPVLDIENNEIRLTWNPYRQWAGEVGTYEVYVNTGSGWEKESAGNNTDTVFSISYSDLMYDITTDEVCFRITAREVSNPHGITGESSSSVVCMPVIELIRVPNTFTPDNNGINDEFYPYLSFTPAHYQFIITDLRRKILFRTNDFTDRWDGTLAGSPMPEGVYLWFLNVSTPSGKTITRTGTVTIIYNR